MASCSNFWLILGCQLVLYCKTSKFVFCKILNTDNIVRLWISAIIILKEWSVVKEKRWQIACRLVASKSRIFKGGLGVVVTVLVFSEKLAGNFSLAWKGLNWKNSPLYSRFLLQLNRYSWLAPCKQDYFYLLRLHFFISNSKRFVRRGLPYCTQGVTHKSWVELKKKKRSAFFKDS